MFSRGTFTQSAAELRRKKRKFRQLGKCQAQAASGKRRKGKVPNRFTMQILHVYGCFQKWWVSPTNPWGSPTKNDHFGAEIGGTPIFGNTHVYFISKKSLTLGDSRYVNLQFRMSLRNEVVKMASIAQISCV